MLEPGQFSILIGKYNLYFLLLHQVKVLVLCGIAGF
jgi:hypothetical protein